MRASRRASFRPPSARFPPPERPTHQIDRVKVAVLVLVAGQDLPQVGDVAGGQAERVELGELGVRRHPGQGGLEAGEGFAQHSHASPLAGVGRVPLDLLALLARRSQRALLARRFLPRLACRAPAFDGRTPLSGRAFGGALAGGGRRAASVHFQAAGAAQYLRLGKVFGIAQRARRHGLGPGAGKGNPPPGGPPLSLLRLTRRGREGRRSAS